MRSGGEEGSAPSGKRPVMSEPQGSEPLGDQKNQLVPGMDSGAMKCDDREIEGRSEKRVWGRLNASSRGFVEGVRKTPYLKNRGGGAQLVAERPEQTEDTDYQMPSTRT